MKKYFLLFIVGIINTVIISIAFSLLISKLGPYAGFWIFAPGIFPILILVILLEFFIVFGIIVKIIIPNNVNTQEISLQPGIIVENKRHPFLYFITFLFGHIVTIFLIGPYVISPATNYVSQKRSEASDKQLETQAISQVYDFSTSTPFGNSLYEKNKIKISGNKIAWFEKVHQPSNQNPGEKLGNDLYTFEINPNTSVGTITQITKSDGRNYREATDISISGEKMYWPSRINGTLSYELFEYDFSTKQKKVISFVPSGERFLAQGMVMLNYYSGVLYNLLKGEAFTRIMDSDEQSPIRFIFNNDKNICYVNKNKQVVLYDVATGNSKIVISGLTQKIPKEDSYIDPATGQRVTVIHNISDPKTVMETVPETRIINLFDCNSNYIVYGLAEQNSNYTQNVFLRVYDITQNKQLTEKTVTLKNEGYFGNLSNTRHVQIRDNYIYYSPFQNDKIYKIDFYTGKESIIFPGNGITEWSVDSGYVVTIKDNTLYLEKFNP